MKRFLFLACIACTMIILTGCEKSNEEYAAIYGTVFDAKLGAPVPNAKVEFQIHNRTVSSAVTGSDGSYEIPNIYNIGNSHSSCVVYVTAASYYSDRQYITIRDGERLRVDVLLEPH